MLFYLRLQVAVPWGREHDLRMLKWPISPPTPWLVHGSTLPRGPLLFLSQVLRHDWAYLDSRELPEESRFITSCTWHKLGTGDLVSLLPSCIPLFCHRLLVVAQYTTNVWHVCLHVLQSASTVPGRKKCSSLRAWDPCSLQWQSDNFTTQSRP